MTGLQISERNNTQAYRTKEEEKAEADCTLTVRCIAGKLGLIPLQHF